MASAVVDFSVEATLGEAAIREGLTILQSMGDQKTPDLAVVLNGLGSVVHDQHHCPPALGYYHQALATSIASSGRDSPEAAAAHNNIGNLSRGKNFLVQNSSNQQQMESQK